MVEIKYNIRREEKGTYSDLNVHVSKKKTIGRENDKKKFDALLHSERKNVLDVNSFILYEESVISLSVR